MQVEIVTPDKKVFDGMADGIQLPGSGGSFEILKNHAPIIATLDSGKVRITLGKEIQYFEITGGVVESKDNKVIVLAESIVE